MKKKFLLASMLTLAIGFTAKSQVGIGNPTPDTTSVLDLTNPNSKGLVLPTAASTANMSNNVNGMTYFFNGNIFYKTSAGYNSLSPWKYKFNGNISNDVYYDLGGKINIGATNLAASPEAPLQIETVNSVDLVNNGSLIIGTSTTTNLAVNNTEIQARNAGSSAPLKINEDGGEVVFGTNTTKVNVKVSDKVQELHGPTATYYDLLPAGTIVMWYGSTTNIPVGWAICAGGNFQKSDGSGNITTPNLSGRFVVATGNNLETNYTPHNTGGQDNVTLTTNQMPTHNHTINDPGHTHSYTRVNHWNTGDGDNANDRNFHEFNPDTSEPTGSSGTGITINNNGGGQAHENRPKYYSLVYMMKL